jgi:hypothetical protein
MGKETLRRSDLRTLKLGAATLAVCIVQTLMESDQSFQSRFLDRLNRAYRAHQQSGEESQDLFETLSWTREMLTGFSNVSGPSTPFLG